MYLYKNKLYAVNLERGETTYHVINRYTGIKEDESTKLPTAIGTAIALCKALELLMEKENFDIKGLLNEETLG